MPPADTSDRASKPKEAPYKLSDGQGLRLLINPNGSRPRRLKYRVAGEEKLLSIGAYPAVSIKMAREARDKAKTLLATGGDPSDVKRASMRAAQETALRAFLVIADEYVAKLRRENRAEVTVEKVL